MIRNFKWSLILNISFRYIFKVNLANRKSFLNIILPRKDSRSAKLSYANVFRVKLGQRICFLFPHLNFHGPSSFLTSAEHNLPIVKQEITEEFWLRKYTYWVVIVVKSVKVRQNTFCIRGYQNEIIQVCLQRFDHDCNDWQPLPWKMGTSNLSLLSLRTWIYRVDWNRTTWNSEAAKCQWKEIRQGAAESS